MKLRHLPLAVALLAAFPALACVLNNGPPAPIFPAGVGALTFSDSFQTLSLHQVWQSGDKWEVITPSTNNAVQVGRGGPNFGEEGAQWWVNPYNANTPIVGIYATDGNGLTLATEVTPPAYQSYINAQAGTNLPYVAGILNNYNTSYQKYGTWAVTAAIPKVPGFTFQADTENVQITGIWPPEIDLRISTDSTNTMTVLFEIAIAAPNTYLQYTLSSNTGFDPTQYHTYAWDWERDFITFYIDGVQKYQTATPTNKGYGRTGDTAPSNPTWLYLLSGANYIGNGNPSAAQLPTYAHVSNVSVFAGH